MNFADFSTGFSADFYADFPDGFLAPPAPSRKRKRDAPVLDGLGLPRRVARVVRRAPPGDEPPTKRRKLTPPEPERPKPVVAELVLAPARPRPCRSKRVHAFYFHFGRLVAEVVPVPRPHFFLRPC